MDVMFQRVAGLDIARDSVSVCVRTPGRGQTRVEELAEFSTMPAQLARLGGWLADRDVEVAAMESTGVYWMPVYFALEDRLPAVWLCNASHLRSVPGRKTDLGDAAWIAQLTECGLVRPSLVPGPEIRDLRQLVRRKSSLIKARTQEVQRLEQALQQMGVKHSSVASVVMSKSLRAMIDALIAGERDPVVIASLAQGVMRNKHDRLVEAWSVPIRDSQVEFLEGVIAHYDFLVSQIDDLDARIETLIAPFGDARELLVGIPGWGPRTVEVFIAQTGGDMSRFPTAEHLASWATLCPANHLSAGRRTKAPPRRYNNQLVPVLIEAAKAASRTKGTYLSALYRRHAARHGPRHAAIVVAHAQICAAWHMLTNGEPYQELGEDHFLKIRHNANKANAVKRLEHLGYTVTLQPLPAAS